MSKVLKFSIILLLNGFLLIFPAFAQENQDVGSDELIRIESDLVVLNATITDKSAEPVRGLKKNEFRIFENGVEQQIDFFEAEETPFAAVILLDTSGSMETRVALAMSAAINFLDGLRPDDQTAIYNFDSKVSKVQDFSNSRDINHRIFDLRAAGWTVLNDAVFEAARILADRPEKKKAIIVLSDGEDSRSRRSESKALRAALDAGATIYTVDMTQISGNANRRAQNQRVLKRFARKTGGTFIKTPGGRELREAFRNIVAELGTQYTLGYHPKNLRRDGKWREIELRVKRPGLSIRTREGYNAPKPK